MKPQHVAELLPNIMFDDMSNRTAFCADVVGIVHEAHEVSEGSRHGNISHHVSHVPGRIERNAMLRE